MRLASQLVSADIIAEGITAIVFLALPATVTEWLFGPTMPPEIPMLVRIAGVGLGLLVIACWLGRRRGHERQVRLALLGYNVFATLLLAGFGILYTPVGILLWPVVVIHAIITAWFVFVGVRSQAVSA